MIQNNITKHIWAVAEIISKARARQGAVGHFYTKYSKTKSPEDVVDEAIKESGASESVAAKIKTRDVGVLSHNEFSEVVQVYRLLMKWRDESKENSGSLSNEQECKNEKM